MTAAEQDPKPWPPANPVDYRERAYAALADLPQDYPVAWARNEPVRVRHMKTDLDAGWVTAAQVYSFLSVRNMLRPTARSEQ